MSFDSPVFLLFLPTVILLHWFCPQPWRWGVLLGGSYLFYGWWNAPLILLILVVTMVSWLAGLLLEQTAKPILRRLWLVLALCVCLGLLGYFKYFNFLAGNASALLGGNWTARDILLPVGISFFTFQAISYVADVYHGTLPAEHHFGYYALYIAFFPQLVAGPIERAGDLLPQLRRAQRPKWRDLSIGARLLLSGFFRKLVVADLCAPFVEAVYCADQPEGYAVAVGTVLFALQIYCDFSGYSEIAAGAARLVGVRLMQNFDQPYLSISIREFWHRWHVSLGRWFTDYIYIPLGGSRKGLGRQFAATLLVFALSGLWHGADWTFAIWGLLHGCFVVVELLICRVLNGGGILEKVPQWAGKLVTFALVCIAWIFFRAESLGQAFTLLAALASPWDVEKGISCLNLGITELLLIAAAVSVLPALKRLTAEEGLVVSDMTWVYLIMCISLAWLIRMASGGGNTFIYFQF